MANSHGTRRKSRSVLTKRNVCKGLSYLLTDYNTVRGENLVLYWLSVMSVRVYPIY